MLITDNPILIKAAEKNYGKFRVPTSFVEAKKIVHHYTNADKASLDIKTSVNKIGEIVNTSQYLNSVMWENIYKLTLSGVPEKEAFESQRGIYKDISTLACESGVEIDSAKRIFEVNIEKSLEAFKNKYYIHTDVNGKRKRNIPLFFRGITLGNGYSLNPNHYYRAFETSMDYLQKAIDRFRAEKIEIKDLPFCEIIKPSDIDWNKVGSTQYAKVNQIISDIKKYRNQIQELYINYQNKSKEERVEIVKEAGLIRNKCVDVISGKRFTDIELYLLLKEIDKERNAGYSRTIFDTLFATGNEDLYNIIRDSTNDIYKITKRTNENSVNLFNYVYFKQKIG